MTSYRLRFHKLALKEWKKLDSTLRDQFKKKLAERLENPRVPSAALSGMPDCYKIKLRTVGYRLVYRVDKGILYVTVIAVGKREKLGAYRSAKGRVYRGAARGFGFLNKAARLMCGPHASQRTTS